MPEFAHRRALTIEWGDCDPAGIVFYPQYFRMFDASTAALFRAATGLRKAEMLARFQALGFPMVDTRARFLIPSAFGDEVTIESRIAEFRRSSFDVQHRLLKGDALAVEGFETRVWTVKDETGRIRSAPLPAELVSAFG